MNSKFKKISVVIPIYNEEKGLVELIKRLGVALVKAKLPIELIFVDDNSTDGTEALFKRLRAKNIIYLKKEGRRGKAYSLMQGFEAATGDAICMIDGDLQYPPEAIVPMLEMLETSDVVIAARHDYNDSRSRKVMSKTFRFVFGKGLFGLNHDIQSGLKIMTSEVVRSIKFNPSSAWTFDLEFLHRARQAGFEIANFDIKFEKRKNGESKINFVRQTVEIGVNALKLRAKRIAPIHLAPKEEGAMIGAGIGFKKNRYITHTTMPHHASALRTFTFVQKTIILLVLADIFLGIYLAPRLTLQIVVAVLSSIYFADVLFNFYLIAKSLTLPQEITSTSKELAALRDRNLPMYTILCPLYREGRVIPQFLEAMGKLSWPKNKLDILLLLEEDDRESIEMVKDMELPSYVRVVVVPDSLPKTKPKACNYGLGFAKGEYLVVYDAEDVPDPMQLKKAYLGFKKAKKDIICLQAKLNYYNPHQNLLTRFFTAEYSLWFDVTLTGLQSIDTTIPLGGTSNHFKTASLREVEGWDPFNVTEDADLGTRLFRKGYKTAIIDSTTLEEANSQWKNWLRQRSRWIKGYMQTYLVHTRESAQPTKKQGVHSLIFQLIIGGKIAFVLINPILWLATIAYFALYAYVGPQIEALYPSVVFYMAVVSLVFGNFLFLYYYMIGVAKKEQWNLMKFIFLIPIYWLMISVAAFIALYQLIFKPHYWEKTVHGLHLSKKEADEVVTEEVIEVARQSGLVFPTRLREKLRLNLSREHLGGGIFVASNALAGFLSFAFASYLGRVLTLEDFALVSLVNGSVSLVSIVFGSLGTTMTYRMGYLMGKSGEESAVNFWVVTRRSALIMSIFISVLWILASPFLLSYFRLSNLTPLLLFSPILLVTLAASADKGLLYSKFNFEKLSIVAIIEPLTRFLLAVSLVGFGFSRFTYATIPFATVVVFLIGWRFVYKNKKKVKIDQARTDYKFPFKFFAGSLLSGIAVIFFLNLDVILAKHYLVPADAGLYALTALIGKMIFFLGGLASPLTVPLVSKNEGANVDSKKFLNLTVLATLIISIPAFLLLSLFGNLIVPIMFGHKAVAALPYIPLVALGMVCFSVARVFTDYYLVKKYYSFPVAAFILGGIQIMLLGIFHTSVWSFVYVMSSVWMLYLSVTLLLHAFSGQVKVIENNIADLFGLFAKLREPKAKTSDKQRVLIFNWRDIKHKWAGGAEVYIHEIAKRWVREGHSVTMFTGKGSKRPTNEEIDGIQVYRRGGFYMVYVWAALYYMLKFRGKYDVIIDSENGIPFFTPLYTKEKTFLLIHHVHQEVFRKSLRWPFSSFAAFLEAKVMPLVYRNTQVITVSPSSRDEIMRHKLTKLEPIVIYNGVDLDLFKPGKKSEKPLVLYVGRLQYYKSLHIFLVAAKRVLKKIPDAEFVIAGEGGEKKKLVAFAEKIGISEKIKFLGKVSHEEKISLFQKAWVFVNPSFMEGWGITTIEANACGTPAVASDVPGLRDSIKDLKTGMLVKYRKYEGFARNIRKLIDDKKLWEKMSGESVAWASNFSWEKSANDMFEVITQEAKKNDLPTGPNKFAFLLGRITSLF